MKKDVGKTAAVLLAIIMAASLLFPATASAKREKVKVAVASFADNSGRNLGKTATDYVTNTFVRLKYFIVLERGRIDQVMREIAHQQTGLVDENTAVEVGKQLGAKVIVVGNVGGAGYDIQRGQCMALNNQGKMVAVPCITATGTATITVRMVKVETGEVIFSDTIKGSYSKNYTGGSRPAPASTMINQALLRACYKLYGPIQKAFPLEGIVIKIEGKVILVDLGSDWGVGRGRGVKIYSRKGKPLKNPVTGEIIGYERELVAKDHVGKVFPTYCQIKVSKKEAARITVGDIVVFKPEIFY